MPKPPASLLLVAHDAGGASLLRELFLPNLEDVRVYASGPAAKILFEFENVYDRITLESAIASSDEVWCGTGWATDLEISTFRISSLTGTPVTAVVDSPYNFEERFRGIDIHSFPATVLVTDLFAEELDLGNLSEIVRPRLRVVKDPMVKRGEAIKKSRIGVESRALYLTQPLRRPGSVSSVDFFRTAMAKIRDRAHFDDLVVRIHPADTIFLNQAMSLAEEFEFSVSTREDFLEDIAISNLVLGVNSNGLRLAAALGIETFSCRSKLSEDSFLTPPFRTQILDID